MAKTYQRTWSPHRSLRSVKAWASLISLRSETWIWKRDQSKHKATWWIFDDSQTISPKLVQEANSRKDLRCIILAFESPHLPGNNWSWVQLPLQSTKLNDWLDVEVAKHIATQQPLPEWQHMAFHLVRKPDISVYGANMALVVACSRMQQSWLSYDALMHLGLSNSVLERFLADTYRSGALETQKMRIKGSLEKPQKDRRDSEVASKPAGLFSSFAQTKTRWMLSRPATDSSE